MSNRRDIRSVFNQDTLGIKKTIYHKPYCASSRFVYPYAEYPKKPDVRIIITDPEVAEVPKKILPLPRDEQILKQIEELETLSQNGLSAKLKLKLKLLRNEYHKICGLRKTAKKKENLRKIRAKAQKVIEERERKGIRGLQEEKPEDLEEFGKSVKRAIAAFNKETSKSTNKTKIIIPERKTK